MENCLNPLSGSLPIAGQLIDPLTALLGTWPQQSSSWDVANSTLVGLASEPSQISELPIVATSSELDSLPPDIPVNLPIVVTEPNDTLATAYQVNDLIVGNTPTVFSGAVDDSDPLDYYQFSLSEASNLNVALTNLTADADVYLYNQDGSVALNRSFRGGSRDEAINQALVAGTYYLGVRQSSGSTDYNLLLSTTLIGSIISAGLPSNLLPAEFEVSALPTPYTRNGFISGIPPIPTWLGNTADVYKVHLETARTVNISLTGLTADLDLRLIQDTNSNQIINVAEQINQSQNPDWASENISVALEAGDYYVQVYSVFGSSSTYTLSIT